MRTQRHHPHPRPNKLEIFEYRAVQYMRQAFELVPARSNSDKYALIVYRGSDDMFRHQEIEFEVRPSQAVGRLYFALLVLRHAVQIEILLLYLHIYKLYYSSTVAVFATSRFLKALSKTNTTVVRGIQKYA